MAVPTRLDRLPAGRPCAAPGVYADDAGYDAEGQEAIPSAEWLAQKGDHDKANGQGDELEAVANKEPP